MADRFFTDPAAATRGIAAKLSPGGYSVDDPDTYIRQLNGVDPDEAPAVRQAQYDRAAGKQLTGSVGCKALIAHRPRGLPAVGGGLRKTEFLTKFRAFS